MQKPSDKRDSAPAKMSSFLLWDIRERPILHYDDFARPLDHPFWLDILLLVVCCPGSLIVLEEFRSLLLEEQYFRVYLARLSQSRSNTHSLKDHSRLTNRSDGYKDH